MPSRISVIAHVDSNDSALVDLVESLDTQSLSSSDFRLIFLVAAADTPLRRRLDHLAARRPNVVVSPFEEDCSNALQSTSAAVATPSVLPLSRQLQGGTTRLHREALQRMSDFLETHDCDVVLARASWSSAADAGSSRIPTRCRPHRRGDGEEALRCGCAWLSNGVPSHPWAAARCRRLGEDGAGRRQDRDTRLVPHHRAPFRGQGCAAPGGRGCLQGGINGVEASWRHGRIMLTAGTESTENELTVVLSIRERVSGLEYWLPPSSEAPESWELDVRSAALGAPVPDGRWSVMSNVYAAGGVTIARSPFPATPLVTGIVDGRPVVPAGVKGGFVIDFGATHFPPVASLDPDQVQITEDARGALLTAQLPNLHQTGRGDLPGAVILDSFRLPARLVADERGARVECFISGLAGESVLATQFGSSPPAPTGLSLVINGVGGMSVTAAPPPPPPAAAKVTRPRADSPQASPKKTTTSGQTKAKKVGPASAGDTKRPAMVARLRRAVPASLEPAVQRLSRNDIARRVYRRLIRG
jgi:hypothetical protein